jgi:DNA replication protein DnaC
VTALKTKLEQLRLGGMSRELDTILAEASRRNLGPAAALEWLADIEIEQRRARSVERRFAQSRLQARLTIDAFDFHHHKSRLALKARILRLLDLDFIAQGANLVIIGNPGTGKTFLAKIIGWSACRANHRVLFTSAMDMLNQLSASQLDHSLVRKLKIYTAPALLLCDEIGYLSLDQETSNLFYQVISTRHAERRSTVLTTNSPFSEWGNILHNTTIATAIADRLVENSEVFLLGGESLRKPKKTRPRTDPKGAGSEEAPLCDDNPNRRSPAG